VTRGQLFTLVYAYMTRHALTKAASADLIALLNTLIPGSLPDNMYFFNKILQSPYSLQTYIYCDSCETFIGLLDRMLKNVLCSGCGKDVISDEMLKLGCFFLLCPLGESLRHLLEVQNLGQQLLENSTCNSTDDSLLTDFTDGAEYKRKHGAGFPASLSLTCNVDGVPVFKSSNTSMWPVFYVVNDLPFSLRRDNVLLHGLWSGAGKPKMECFLTPIVDELATLNKNKLTWQTKQGTTFETTVILDLLVCDSVARPPLQNFKQFNGEFGCSFCLHKGVPLPKGQGFVRTYPSEVQPSQPRTHMQTLQFASEAEDKGLVVSGVKGFSLLYAVPSFDVISGFNPECMHSIMLGVVKQFVGLWLDSSSAGKQFYLRPKAMNLNSLLVACKPPSEVKRLPRSLDARCYWKASEWRAFLLLYSAVVLKNILPDEYYRHWLLLVYGVYNLHQKKVKVTDLCLCDLALNKFVAQVPELYGDEHVSYNVHLLVHVTNAVKNWGPLWATSAFVFEDSNRILLRLLHGTRKVSKQVCCSFSNTKYLQPMAKEYFRENTDHAVAKLLSKFCHIRVPCARAVRFHRGVVAVGNAEVSQLTVSELLALEACIGTVLLGTIVTRYCRVIINGMVLHTGQYASKFKRNDSLVTLNNFTGVFSLHSCVHFPHSDELFFIFRRFHVRPLHITPSDINCNLLQHVWKVHLTANLVACTANNIGHKCIGIADASGSLCCSSLPFFELD